MKSPKIDAQALAMPELMSRVKVVSSAAVTWLTVAGAVAALLVDELADFPAAADLASKAGIMIATATTIIRRVTPVAAGERGLL